jgi:hypothetical protein
LSDALQIRGSLQIFFTNNHLLGQIYYNSSTSIINILQSKNQHLPNALDNIQGKIQISGTTTRPLIKIETEISTDISKNKFLYFPLMFWNKLSNANWTNNAHYKLKIASEINKKKNKIYLQNFQLYTENISIHSTKLALDSKTYIVTGIIKIYNVIINKSQTCLLDNKHNAITIKCTASNKNKQQLSIQGSINNKSKSLTDYKHFTANICVSDLWNYKISKAEITINVPTINNSSLNTLKLNLYYNDKNSYIATVVLDNNSSCYFNLKLATNISMLDDKTIQVNIYQVKGQINNNPIRNTTNIKIYTGHNTYIECNNLLVGRGSINIKTTLNKTHFLGGLKFKNIPITTLNNTPPINFLGSSVNCNITLAGSAIQPFIFSNINISNIKSTQGKVTIYINSNLNTDNCRLNTQINLNNKYTASLISNLPHKFDLIPPEYIIVHKEPFKTLLFTKQPIELFSLIPIKTKQVIYGLINGHILIDNRFTTPRIHGIIKLADGKYKCKNYEIKLKNIRTTIRTKNTKIFFSKIKAKDILNNSISGHGKLLLNNYNKNYQFTIKTNQFLLQGIPYSQGLFKGALSLIGYNKKLKAIGKLDITPLEIIIPEHFQQKNNIPKLNNSSIIKTKHHPQTFITNIPHQLNLNIILRMMDHIYIKGWGINTLLHGKIKVTGCINNPIINGTLKSIRGYYQEFGKTLNIKQGFIKLYGPLQTAAHLNIIAETIDKNTKIRLILSGPTYNPHIKIESTPRITREQIVSKLLFHNKTLQNNPKLQILQLINIITPRPTTKKNRINIKNTNKISILNSAVKINPNNYIKNVIHFTKSINDKTLFSVKKNQRSCGVKSKFSIHIRPKILITSNNTMQNKTNNFKIYWQLDY